MRLVRRLVEGAEYRSGLGNPESWLIDALGAGSSWSGQRVTAEKALQIPAVRGAISLISWAISLCPLKVYRDEDDGTQSEQDAHRAWPMLHDKPNSNIPADAYWQLVARQLLRYGNHFSEKRRDPLSGLVNELIPLPPTQTTVEWNSRTGTKVYVVEPKAAGEQRRRLSADDVLHIMGDTDDGLIGRSPLEECREALGTALARMEFEASFYRRGAVLSGVIQHPGKLREEGVARLKKGWSAAFAGSKQAHGTPVLEEGATFQRTGAPLQELEFNESERRTRTDIALMFNLPSGFLAGDTGESLKYSTVEGNQIQFAQYAVAPWANRIAKAISADRSIFPFPSWYCEFVLEGLMRGDSLALATVYEKLFGLVDGDGRRAIETNEIRALENRRPARKQPNPDPAALPAGEDVPPVAQQPPALNVARLRG